MSTARLDVQASGRGALTERGVLDALDAWARVRGSTVAACTVDGRGECVNEWTYERMAKTVRGLSHALAQRVPRDGTVLLQCANSPEYVAWFLGAIGAGVRVAALHPQSTAHEVRALAERLGARLHIGMKPVDAGPEFVPALLVDEIVGASNRGEVRGEGSVILQSSGTTGLPKLVRRGERSLDADAAGVMRAASLTPDDGVVAVVPLSHSYGVDLLVASILAGATLLILEGFEPAALLAHLARGRSTVFPGVPFMFAALTRERTTAPPMGLRAAFSAGATLSLAVHESVQHAWGSSLGQLYGASELGSVTLGLPEMPGFDAASVGAPMRGVSIRIVQPGESGRELQAGEEGELAVRAPSMLDEYVGDVAPMVDGHFLTGDLGRIDGHGHVHITGRLKHLIDVGGLKVNPLEIEAVFGAHPAVADCAVTALPLSDTVTRLRLLYVPRESAGSETVDLRGFGRERLAPYKLPRVFEAVDSLPRTATGKLLRHHLP